MNRPKPNQVYQSGRILRFGTPLLASLVAAITAVGVQAVLPIKGPWVPVIAIAGGLAVTALLLLWQHVTRRQLEVFDGWFRYVLPDRTLIAHWDDVVEVFSPTTRRRKLFGRHEYVVVLGGGTTLRLGSEIGANAELGDEIEARTRDLIVERTSAHISSGRAVRFGPITVDQKGITVKKFRTRSIPFDRLRHHRLTGRHYLLRSMDDRGTSAIPVSQIPNPAALYDVVEQRVAQAGASKHPGSAAA